MNRIFGLTKFFRVGDGTLVSPFLNCKDSESGLPFDMLDGFSLAAGTIEPRTRSKIHIMPFVTQVTFVRRGRLKVQMKAAEDEAPYLLSLNPNEAVVTRPGTYFQLINESDEPCEVLYIVSPAYLYEKSGYDDSVVLAENWDDLTALDWQPSKKFPTAQERGQAAKRLASQHQTA